MILKVISLKFGGFCVFCNSIECMPRHGNNPNYHSISEKPLPPMRKHPMDIRREPFDYPSQSANPEPYHTNLSDHDYRKHSDTFGRQYPPKDYYNGEVLHHDRRPREMIPFNEHPPLKEPHFYDRRTDRHHPPRLHPFDHDGRSRGWREDDRYGYEHSHRFPSHRRPPPFNYPHEPMPPVNYIPPNKRPLPSDKFPLDEGKYSRSDKYRKPQWGGGYDRW